MANKTTAELANEVLDNWRAHFFDAHPEVILQAITERTIAKHSCTVCSSLHAQLDAIGR